MQPTWREIHTDLYKIYLCHHDSVFFGDIGRGWCKLNNYVTVCRLDDEELERLMKSLACNKKVKCWNALIGLHQSRHPEKWGMEKIKLGDLKVQTV